MIKNICLIAAALVTMSAGALTLKEQKMYKEWKERLNTGTQYYADQIKEKCGYAIPVSIEEKFATPFMA